MAGGNPTIYGYVFDSNIEVDILGLATVYLRNNEIYVGKAKQNAKTRYKSDKVNSATDIPDTDTAQGVEQITYERLKESKFIDEVNPVTNKKRPVNMDKKDKAKRREYGEKWLKEK